MADLVAPAVTAPVVPEWVKLDPFWDHPLLLGVPTWFFVLIGVVFCIVVVNLYWLFRMGRLKDVKGYKDTLKKASQEDVQTWVLGKTQRLTIEMLRYVDSILSYYTPTRISKWHHNTPMSVMHVGGLPALMVSDDFDQTRDVVSELAILHAAEHFNEFFSPVIQVLDAINSGNTEDLMKMMDRERIDKIKNALEAIGGCDVRDLKPIDSYREYERCGHKILKILMPDGVPIPSYCLYNPVKFRKYFPKGCSAGFFGGELIRDSRKLVVLRPEKSFWEKMIPLAGLVIVDVIALIAAWNIPLGR